MKTELPEPADYYRPKRAGELRQKATRLERVGALLAILALAGTLWLSRTGWPAIRRFWETTELYEAVARRDPVVALRALRRGANPNAPWSGGLRGGTPLAWAVQERDAA